MEPEQVLQYQNFNLTDVVTPVNAVVLKQLLVQSSYNKRKTQFLIDGFTNGFSLEYEGNMEVKRTSPNLKLTKGSITELWNKVMKEVKEGRYAGPFKEIPFEYYIQSPIGLVPKDGGKSTRLIFHLSHPRNNKKESVNANTPEEKAKVKYCSFDEAIRRCIEEGKGCKIAKSDMKSAFRNLGIKREHWPLLVMKATNPNDGVTYYFVDKCLPFGASISCAHFQTFSNAIAHLVKFRTQKKTINYLDDYFFAALLKLMCDLQVQVFLDVCQEINFPVSIDKTFWGCTQLTFLGLLIDNVRQLVAIPQEKLDRVVTMINYVLTKSSKKITVLELQKLCEYLNFLGRSIVPGRTFTRRLYAGTASGSNKKLLPHHHVRVTGEMKLDLEMWKIFLDHPSVFCRSFKYFNTEITSDTVMFYTDASMKYGLGGFCGGSWMHALWDPNFIHNCKPSIEYLELFALTAGVLTWIHRFSDRNIIIFCDNTSVMNMINNSTSGCKNCMVLIRLVVLHCMVHNVTLKVQYIRSAKNDLADSLSRNNLKEFFHLIDEKKLQTDKYPTLVPQCIWPVYKIWQ